MTQRDLFTTKVLSGEDGLERAAALLRANEVVAFPTETVYGLGARIFSTDAVKKIFVAKQRPSDNPLIAHISDLNQAERIASELSDTFFTLMHEFAPGPLTVVVPVAQDVPQVATAGLSTIGIRMPSHPIARQLIALVGEPIVAPSANLSGRPSPTSAEHVLQDLSGRIPMVLDGGQCDVGIESTVLTLTDAGIEILRPGIITREKIEKVIDKQVINRSISDRYMQDDETPRSPGMKYRHYAPSAAVTLIENWNDFDYSNYPQRTTLILSMYPDRLPLDEDYDVQLLNTKSLFSLLRQADEDGYQHVLVDAATLSYDV